MKCQPFLAATAAFFVSHALAAAQGTAFTYQGRLGANGGLANGVYDLRFAIHSAAGGGAAVGTPVDANAVLVSNGLFAVTLDFGPGVFTGPPRWLEIGVKTNGVAEAHDTLAPRQPLTATPYAVTAGTVAGPVPAAQLSGAVPSANLAGTYSAVVRLDNPGNVLAGDGAGLTALNASRLTTGTVPEGRLAANIARTNQVWLLGGNEGTTPGTHFLGTRDNRPVELKVNGVRALRLEPVPNTAVFSNIANVVAGSASNYVAPGAVGGTIAGGGATLYAGQFLPNRVGADYGTVGGGNGNSADGIAATIGGGGLNSARAYMDTIGGGLNNEIQTNATFGVIAGGGYNAISGLSEYGTVSGGYNNRVGSNAFAVALAGGANNLVGNRSRWSTIGGGVNNWIQNDSSSGTIDGGSFNSIGTNAVGSTIGGGTNNVISHGAPGSTISGGHRNDVGMFSTYATIAGGVDNQIDGNVHSAVGGGERNRIVGPSGGAANVIAGGADNAVIRSLYGTIAGGGGNTVGSNSYGGAIGGGGANTLGEASRYCTIAGGVLGTMGLYTESCFIGSGEENTIEPFAGHSSIVGGAGNIISSNASACVIGGGQENRIAAGARFATIAGGQNNIASSYCFAAGRNAAAIRPGSFVFSDSNGGSFPSIATNSVSMRASGGYYLYSSAGLTTGVTVAPGSGTWGSLSDRNAKENFAPVDSQAILDKVLGLPVTSWNYRSQEASIRHLGVMAQDFHSAFALNGSDDRQITTVDADGVALAAIQGLNEKVVRESRRNDARLQALETENKELRRELDEIKAMLVNHTARVDGRADGRRP